MGSGNLRNVVIQPGPDILSYIRDRGMSCGIIICGREGSQDLLEEDE